MLVKLSYKESWLCWLQLSFKPESCLPGEWVKEQDGWFLILLLFFLWCLLSSPLCPTLVWTHKHSKPLSFLSKSALCQHCATPANNLVHTEDNTRWQLHTPFCTHIHTQTDTSKAVTQATFTQQESFLQNLLCSVAVFMLWKKCKEIQIYWKDKMNLSMCIP